MSKQQRVTKLIQKYGTKVQVLDYDEQTVLATLKAIIQPLRYRSENSTYTDTGYFKNEIYYYTGPANIRIDTYPLNTVLLTQYDKYIIKKANKVYLKDEIIYISAVLEKCTD